jgi:hypothetical protein
MAQHTWGMDQAISDTGCLSNGTIAGSFPRAVVTYHVTTSALSEVIFFGAQAPGLFEIMVPSMTWALLENTCRGKEDTHIIERWWLHFEQFDYKLKCLLRTKGELIRLVACYL